MILKNKIDFAIVFSAENCNPNGDPAMFNMPRKDLDGYGEMTSVCIKRKIRDRLQELGYPIFVQSGDRVDDGCYCLKDRAQKCAPFFNEVKKKDKANIELCQKIACENWFDVRTFGQIFTFKSKDAVSFGVRGPVSVRFAKTLEPIMTRDFTITKSTNTFEPGGKETTTMGHKYVIDKGAYVSYGSIFPQLASKTGFSEEDAEVLKEAIKILLNNDASCSRPSGTMTSFLYWWNHSTPIGNLQSARVFQSLNIQPTKEWPYFTVKPNKIEGVTLEIY